MCVCVYLWVSVCFSHGGLRGICHVVVGAGPNLFIETDNLFSYIHWKRVARRRRRKRRARRRRSWREDGKKEKEEEE